VITGSLARRYAKAIIGLQPLDRIANDLRSLSAAMAASSELSDLLSNPAIRRSDRRKVVDALLDRITAQPITRNLISLLLDHERLDRLPMITRELDAMIEAKAGRVSAEVVSARPLDSSQIQLITGALEKLSGKRVDVRRREDPALLGGVVAKVGDIVYDGSLRTQLHNLRDELAGNK
jgi:F-type H+-transporting ATPase subunit delta